MNEKRILILTLMLLFTSIQAVADMPLRFTHNGDFVPPGKLLQEDGVRAYRMNQLDYSLAFFKRSAKFGNEMSKYMISLIYFEQQNWVSGYTWLRLIKAPIEERDSLLMKFNKELTKEEKHLSDEKLKLLRLTYNDYESYMRRLKWENSKVFTGTHIHGFTNIDNNNLLLWTGALGTAKFGLTNKNNLKQSVKGYLIEFEPMKVIMGEIKEVDE